MKASSLRKKYPKFIYKDYSYQVQKKDLKISFYFKIPPDIRFRPKLTIKNISNSRFKKIEKEVLNNLVFNLGLIEMISYWKTTCSPQIKIEAGLLGRNKINWWKELIINGMGQFFYENKINWRKSKFISISSQNKNTKPLKIFKKGLKDEFLIPIGGGKDSAVSLEIIKKVGLSFTCFCLNPTANINEIMKAAKCKNPVIVKRKIDPKLLKLNRQGFLNGHTPFSAYLAFLSVLVSVLFNKKQIAFSNERSSNEGNLKYLGKEINHQYSKSFDFEKNFRKYGQEYLVKNSEYFSLLRPLYTIQVAKIFSRYSKYFSSFLSCNEAFKTKSGIKKTTGKWCGECAKCLFVFAVLYPFIQKEKLIKIFGGNLFQNKKLLPLMRSLVGIKKYKPFECVGTREESLVAFYLSWKKANRVGERPFLLEYFENKILPRKIQKGFIRGKSQYPSLEKKSKKILTSWNKKHNLPKKLWKEIEKMIVVDTSGEVM